MLHAFMLILLSLVTALSANAQNTCSDLFAPESNSSLDPLNPGLVLMAGKEPEEREIHEQIIASLPKDVRPVIYRRALSPWIRDWFPFIKKDPVTGRPRFIQFKPFNSHGEESASRFESSLKSKGYRVEHVQAFLDWGNVISDGQRVFVVKDHLLLEANQNEFGLNETRLKKLIESTLERKLVWLPELPREVTGHADIYLSYLGGNNFVVADSRDRVRKKALDQAADILKKLNYNVIRILNAGHDAGEIVFSYTNTLIVGHRILVPVYSAYFEKISREPKGRLYVRMGQIASENDELFKSIASSEDSASQLVKLIGRDDINAIRTYQELGFDVYPIYMNKIIDLDGMVHCLTRCLPAEYFNYLPRW